MRRFALLLPALLLLACSDDSGTGPVAETPDPFWSGTAPAVRLTVVRDAQGRADRTALVRVEALWDSAWTPGATDRRVWLGGEDSTMQNAAGASWYGSITKDGAMPRSVTTGSATFVIPGKAFSADVLVYCPNKHDSTQVGASLLQGEISPVRGAVQPAVWIHCKD